jgi:hypothetical protein
MPCRDAPRMVHAGSSAGETLGGMARADIVGQRVLGLVENFDRYVSIYDSSTPFSSERLAVHRATIALRRDAGSVRAAVTNPAFVRSLRATLVAWGLNVRASRLAPEPEFGEALQQALPALTALEPLAIDDPDLPTELPEQLWTLLRDLGIVGNDAKVVAGTKTLHHLLPELTPPMDRAWTGTFFGLHPPEWQGDDQRRTFLRMYRAFTRVAQQTDPGSYVTGVGWRTSRTKILDNAVIGYCTAELLAMSPAARTPTAAISFHVSGYPPAKNEALSILGANHSHATRVLALLEAARRALAGSSNFISEPAADVALELVLRAGDGQDPSGATNYLGGVADVLEDKTRALDVISHLGELGQVWLYRSARQVKQVTYREESGGPGYRVTIRVLDGN